MREIELSDGIHKCIVDDDTFHWLNSFRWHFIQGPGQPIGYAQCWNPYPKAILVHRMISDVPDYLYVHHKNNDTLDNRKENLQIVTQSVNQLFRLGVKGYHWEASRGKWKAQIMVNGANIFIGRFDNEEDASVAYQLTKEKVLANLLKEEIFGNNGNG